MLDVRKLRLLRELAHRGTIAAVADALAYTPSAVSQQLAALEREAGVPLLRRTGRRVALTPAGAALAEQTEAVLALLEQASAQLAATRGGLTGPLRIGAFPTAVRTILPAALVSLGRDHPGLELMVTELDPAGVPDALRTGALDVALVHEYDYVPTEPDPALDTDTHDVSFDLAGAAIPLEAIGGIQTARLPVGGRLNLQARGQGPLQAPEMHATLRLIDLKLGSDVVGSFDGKVDSDGHHLSATIESAMATGRLSGKMDVSLGSDYPVTAEVTAERIDFDPFLLTAMRLSHLNGHSLVDGHFAIAGFAARPETIAVQANLSRITIDFEKINLENVGPVRLTYQI